MSDRIFAKAQSEGWTDLFINEGKVWGYRQSSDVMPQQYREQRIELSEIGNWHYRIGAVGPQYFSCDAALQINNAALIGQYSTVSSRRGLPGYVIETFRCDQISDLALNEISPHLYNRERFAATLIFNAPIQPPSKIVECVVESLETQNVYCGHSLQEYSRTVRLSIFNHTAHTPAAPFQPAPMQHPQP
jgi:hypothetical protein